MSFADNGEYDVRDLALVSLVRRLAHVTIVAENYAATLARIAILMSSENPLECVELLILALLIERYEHEKYPLDNRDAWKTDPACIALGAHEHGPLCAAVADAPYVTAPPPPVVLIRAKDALR